MPTINCLTGGKWLNKQCQECQWGQHFRITPKLTEQAERQEEVPQLRLVYIRAQK